MKLSNYVRDAFISAVMQDVPFVDYEEQIRQRAIKTAVAKLPPKVRAIWNDKELRGYLATSSDWIGPQRSVRVTYPGDYEILNALNESCAELVEKAAQQKAAHKALSEKLTAVAYSCSTQKALLETLPEFEKYITTTAGSLGRSAPVVANVAAEFVKAGWPKKATKTEIKGNQK